MVRAVQCIKPHVQQQKLVSTLTGVHSAPVVVADAPGGYLKTDDAVHDRPLSELRQRHDSTCHSQLQYLRLTLQVLSPFDNGCVPIS